MEDGGTLTLGRPGKPLPHRIKLVVVSGPDAGAEIVARQGAIVGRAKQVDLALTDPAVSSFHVELRPGAEGILVRDLDSRNGTFFGGARIERAIVPIGAELTMGGSVVRIDYDVATEDAAAVLGSFGAMRGASSAMQALFAWLARVAPSDLALLVEGPAGSGKELALRSVHAASRVASGPFVVLDCVAMPEIVALGLADLFVAAKGGTVFIDEIGELDGNVQETLVRMLDRGQRVVASSRRELRSLVNQGRFREDLYFRIAQARAVIPPLAPEDVPTLALHFLQSLPSEVKAVRRIAREAMEELKRRDYPGNVRELRATVERAAVLSPGPAITIADLAFERILTSPRETSEITPFKDAKRTVVEDFEREYLEKLVLRVGDNVSQGSIVSGVERHHLRDLLRKHGLRRGS